MIRLEVLQGQDKGRVLETSEDTISIGRAPGNTLVLGDWHISGEHGTIQVRSDQFTYRDLRSTNGSIVLRGEERIGVDEDRNWETALQSGDRLLLGDREQPVLLSFASSESPDRARVMAVRSVDQIVEVEGKALRNPEELKNLHAALKRIGGALDLEEVLDEVADALFELVPKATHVTVVLQDDDGHHVPMTTRVRGQKANTEPVPITRSVFRKVIAERASVLAANAVEEVAQTESIMGAHILSTMGVPLWKGDRIIGVLQVDNRSSPGIFRERDLDMVTLLSAQASLAVANARLHRQVQMQAEAARKENTYLKAKERKRFDHIVGDSSAMRAVFDQLAKVVDTRVTVLIEGETGTGKELVASSIHYQSKRRDKLFVAQNCAALPETLLESELYGHKKGSFTGADQDKKGLFEIADGGTLFLDEVTEMPLTLQSKLLRVLQEGEIRPVGGSKTKNVNVRIVAATNRNLDEEVKGGRFREDLYYRLKVFPLRLPPLRERREDIPLLAGFFLERYCQEMGKPIGGFGQQAMELLQSYKWPGNVRELENEVQRLVIQIDPHGFVMPDHLSPRIRQVENLLDRIGPRKGTLKDMVEQVEKWILVEALREHGGNKSATAKTLGITREGLHKKLSKFGM
ncbi:MAG: sigma 54-interacting transcriptional regulator [Deltaproteobacteria bacterium]|nr:sigma 54-interacting transcriptional regulator [Deltaproteobacteria bacterium]